MEVADQPLRRGFHVTRSQVLDELFVTVVFVDALQQQVPTDGGTEVVYLCQRPGPIGARAFCYSWR